jgi:hypothetical protein
MAFDLRDAFETVDGSRPDPSALPEALGKKHALTAFAVLLGGDAFERSDGKANFAHDAAENYADAHLRIKAHFAPKNTVRFVRERVAELICANPPLIRRLLATKKIRVDIIPPKKSMVKYGFPEASSARAAGLFWDHPDWPEARMALRREHVGGDNALVVHEMAHAIHYLAFTARERKRIYQVLKPVFDSRAAMDEVFAIYSEREMVDNFSALQKRAPGVYGFTRKQWDEDHLFTRFVRKLYRPHKALSGRAEAERRGAAAWKGFSG